MLSFGDIGATLCLKAIRFYKKKKTFILKHKIDDSDVTENKYSSKIGILPALFPG